MSDIAIHMGCAEVKRTERGWLGHYILADRCNFRRNTLLECEGIRIVISTVGLLRGRNDSYLYFETVGSGRYFETMVFHANSDERYYDPDVQRQVYPASPWRITDPDADDLANDMHERIVEEITHGLMQGNLYDEGR